jgi:hypothetical protein
VFNYVVVTGQRCDCARDRKNILLILGLDLMCMKVIFLFFPPSDFKKKESLLGILLHTTKKFTLN